MCTHIAKVDNGDTLQMTTSIKDQGRKRSTSPTTTMAPAAFECEKGQVDEVSNTSTMTKEWEMKSKSPEDHVLEEVEALSVMNDQNLTISIECFDDAVGEFAKAENELLAKLNVEIQKNNFQKCQNKGDPQHVCVYKSCLQTSVEDMNEMTDEYNEMKTFVVQTNAMMDQLRTERDCLKLQVNELTNKIQGMTEQDSAIIAAVDAKVEEWKHVFSEKDAEILGYKQAVKERDIQIKKLREYSKRKDRGLALSSRHRKVEELKSRLEAAESRVAVAEMAVKVAEAHVEEKDKSLNEVTMHLRRYESSNNGLDAALAEIKDCKNQIKDMTNEKKSRVILEKEVRLVQAQLKAKVEELLKVKQDQEALLRDILQTIKGNQEDFSPGSVGETSIGGMGDVSWEPALQVQTQRRQMLNSLAGMGDGSLELALQVKAQVQTLSKNNQDVRQELNLVREEAKKAKENLESAFDKIREHDQTISDTRATCNSLTEKLEEKEASMSKAEQQIESRDEVITELRRQLSAAVAKERQLADSIRTEVNQSESHRVLKLARQTIKELRQQLDQKQDVIKKFHQQAEQNQTEMRERYCEELGMLEQKLTLHMITSLDHFKQQAGDLVEKSTLSALPNQQLECLEETVIEQDRAIASLTEELKLATAELGQHRITVETQATKYAVDTSTMETHHAARVKALTAETENLRNQVVQMEKEIQNLHTQLEAQKEASGRSTSNAEVGRLKANLDQKEKQIKSLSKALLELRAEMMSAAERQALAEAAQKQESQNVQKLIDKHTQDLKVQVQELCDELEVAHKSVKTAKGRENGLAQEVDSLSRDLQRSHKAQRRAQAETEEKEQDVLELRQQNKRLNGALQKLQEQYGKGLTIENLQKKIRRLELELEKAVMKNEHGNNQGKAKEDGVHWDEGMKLQAKLNKVMYSLMDKERENESLSKELCTLKDLYSRLTQENGVLQKKLRVRGAVSERTARLSEHSTVM